MFWKIFFLSHRKNTFWVGPTIMLWSGNQTHLADFLCQVCAVWGWGEGEPLSFTPRFLRRDAWPVAEGSLYSLAWCGFCLEFMFFNPRSEVSRQAMERVCFTQDSEVWPPFLFGET
jgi:hypothetical protein